MGYCSKLCTQAGRSIFHPLFRLSPTDIELEQERIASMPDAAMQKFQDSHLQSVLRTRSRYQAAHNAGASKKDAFLVDFLQGAKAVKSLVVSCCCCCRDTP